MQDIKLGSVQFAVKRLIDSVWTVSYIEVTKGKAKILTHDRRNPIGYASEASLPQVNIIESDGRIVQELVLYEAGHQNNRKQVPVKRLEVINKKHIFSY